MSEKRELGSLVVDDTEYTTAYTPKFMRRKPFVRSDPRRVAAHIPGVVQGIWVAVGQRVRWGERLLVLEAMKMRNDVTSPVDGVVKAIHVAEGALVARGQPLIELE